MGARPCAYIHYTDNWYMTTTRDSCMIRSIQLPTQNTNINNTSNAFDSANSSEFVWSCDRRSKDVPEACFAAPSLQGAWMRQWSPLPNSHYGQHYIRQHNNRVQWWMLYYSMYVIIMLSRTRRILSLVPWQTKLVSVAAWFVPAFEQWQKQAAPNEWFYQHGLHSTFFHQERTWAPSQEVTQPTNISERVYAIMKCQMYKQHKKACLRSDPQQNVGWVQV
jgi:hypothetical protein